MANPAILTVTARADGFRRAGIAHPAEPTHYLVEDFTPRQLDALLTEPMLVTRLHDDAEIEAALRGAPDPVEPNNPESEGSAVGAGGAEQAAGQPTADAVGDQGAAPPPVDADAVGKPAKARAAKARPE